MKETCEGKSGTGFGLVTNNVFKTLEWKLLRKEMDNNDGVRGTFQTTPTAMVPVFLSLNICCRVTFK